MDIDWEYPVIGTSSQEINDFIDKDVHQNLVKKNKGTISVQPHGFDGSDDKVQYTSFNQQETTRLSPTSKSKLQNHSKIENNKNSTLDGLKNDGKNIDGNISSYHSGIPGLSQRHETIGREVAFTPNARMQTHPSQTLDLENFQENTSTPIVSQEISQTSSSHSYPRSLNSLGRQTDSGDSLFPKSTLLDQKNNNKLVKKETINQNKLNLPSQTKRKGCKPSRPVHPIEENENQRNAENTAVVPSALGINGNNQISSEPADFINIVDVHQDNRQSSPISHSPTNAETSDLTSDRSSIISESTDSLGSSISRRSIRNRKKSVIDPINSNTNIPKPIVNDQHETKSKRPTVYAGQYFESDKCRDNLIENNVNHSSQIADLILPSTPLPDWDPKEANHSDYTERHTASKPNNASRVSKKTSKPVYNPEDDKKNFVQLLKEIRHLLRPDQELTVAISGSREVLKKSYDLVEMAKYVDYFLVMAYDFTAPQNTADHMSNLYRRQGSFSYDTEEISSAVSEGIFAKLSKKDHGKVILGIPLYGRVYARIHGGIRGLGGTPESELSGIDPRWGCSSTESTGESADPLTVSVVKYNQIPVCGAQTFWDEECKAPYTFDVHIRRLTTYDSPLSLLYKLNWLTNLGGGGLMFWELSGDTASLSDVNSMRGAYIDAVKKIKGSFGNPLGLEGRLNYENSPYENIRVPEKFPLPQS